MNPWQQLGLSGPTADKRAIKKAYARLLRENNPEDDPAGFQALRQAYEQALDQADYLDPDDFDDAPTVSATASSCSDDWLEQPVAANNTEGNNKSGNNAEDELPATQQSEDIPQPSGDNWLEGETASAQWQERETQPSEPEQAAPAEQREPSVDAHAIADNICQQAAYNVELALAQLDQKLNEEFIELDARRDFEEAVLNSLADESGPNGSSIAFIDGVLERFQIDLSKAGQSRDYQMNWLTSRIELRREVSRLQQAMRSEQDKQSSLDPATSSAIAFLQSNPSSQEINSYTREPQQQAALIRQFRLLMQASPSAAEELCGQALVEWGEEYADIAPADSEENSTESTETTTWRPWLSRFFLGVAIIMLFRVITSAADL